jgi:hypothetical protein
MWKSSSSLVISASSSNFVVYSWLFLDAEVDHQARRGYDAIVSLRSESSCRDLIRFNSIR